MKDLKSKTTAVFSQPFNLPGFDGTMPAGEYDIETELFSPPDQPSADAWKASVMVHLHSRSSYPGLARSLTVSLADLDNARAIDKLSGKELSQVFLEEMLADPMVRLVMEADGVSEVQLRHLYSGARSVQTDAMVLDFETGGKTSQNLAQDMSAIQVAENEGMPTLSGTSTALPMIPTGKRSGCRLTEW